MTDVNTIAGTVKRCREENLPISENALRQWVKQGKIPYRKAGRVFLLYFPNVRDFLTCVDGGDNARTDASTHQIRRLNF